jgi:hypothetical protein
VSCHGGRLRACPWLGGAAENKTTPQLWARAWQKYTGLGQIPWELVADLLVELHLRGFCHSPKASHRVLQIPPGSDPDWSPPKSRLLCRGIKDCSLAVIISGCETIDVNAETERHSSKPAGGTRNGRIGCRLKNFVASEIKGDKSEKRLARWGATLRRLLIGLEVHLHLVTCTEDSSHARDRVGASLSTAVKRLNSVSA